MKRIITLLILTAMLTSALFGCTGQPAATTDTEKVTETETDPVTTETEPVTTEEVTTEPETETEPETTADPFPEPDENVLKAEPSTAFTVSRVFSDNMVVQRNDYIRVWGFAGDDQNGKRVNAEFSGLTGAALVEDGKWMITLNGSLPENTEPQEFKVYGDGVEYVFKDVLVGDVYWMVGQSNATYPVSAIRAEPRASQGGKKVGISNDDLIRLNLNTADEPSGLTVGTAEVNEDVPSKRGWKKPVQLANLFSALGYFTAKQLYDALEGKIPIGMIEFAYGGAALNAFCPNEICDKYKIDKLNTKKGIYEAPSVNNHPTRFIYNHYMYAFQKYPICGIIWYQGESDCAQTLASKYPERFAGLIEEYRNRHDLINHDYPVYIIEFPAIFMNFDYAAIRQYMGTLPNYVTNAHLCQSSDLWKDKTYENNLHPYVKWEQATRMTSIILADRYGVGDVTYKEGPSIVSVEYAENKTKITLKFRNVGDGLKAEGGEIKGLKVKYSAKWEDPVTAEITGKDTIVITGTKTVKQIGYNTAMQDTFPETITLCNSEGVPCNSFIIK